MSGRAIYESFTNSSLQVGGLVSLAGGTAQLASNYQNRSFALQRLLLEMRPHWKGDSGEGAQRAAGPLVTEHDIAAPLIARASGSMEKQASDFQTAKNSVVPVPDLPEKPGTWDNFFTNGVAGVQYEQQVKAIQAANDHNIDVMKAYEKETRANQDLLSPIANLLNPLPPGQPPQPPPPPQPGPPSLPWRVPKSGGGDGQQDGTGGDTATPAPTPQTTGHTTTVGQTHADSAQLLPPRTSGVDGGWPRPAGPAPLLPQSPGAGPPVAGGGGFGPGGGGSGAGADPRRAAAPGGARGSGGPGESGGRSGGRGGIGGPRGGALEGMPGRGPAGTSTASARSGPGGQPPMGQGGRAEGDEDIERLRPSFLVDPDPDETFGTDEVTAPPVIGG